MNSLKDMILSAMFIAIGIVLPFFIGQIPIIGQIFLPMHYPILLCGIVCGWKYGLVVGFVTPLLRSVLFGFPVMFPNGIAMAFELATYCFVIGYIYHSFKTTDLLKLYISLIIAMICGRIVWGIVEFIIVQGFTIKMFMAGALINALPGIAIQLVLIQAIVVVLDKLHIVQFKR